MTRLDTARIHAQLRRETATGIDRLEVFREIDSTNTHLKNTEPPPPGKLRVALAEHQSAGRGRHERSWVSAPGSSLCLSAGYTFRNIPDSLPPLTLALGVGMAAPLSRLAKSTIRLKWPNDLLLGDAKLGGILTETHSRRGPTSIVAGVGINVSVPDAIAAGLAAGWAHSPVGLDAVMAEIPRRDDLAAALLDALYQTFVLYDEAGFSRFEVSYSTIDWLAGRRIVADTARGAVVGMAAGVDSAGRLLIDTGAGIERIVSGSISWIDAGKSPA